MRTTRHQFGPRAAALLAILGAIAGCGDDGSFIEGPPGDVLRFDAAVLDRTDGGPDDAGQVQDTSVIDLGGDVDAGTVRACDDAVATRNGVLTNAVSATFTDGSPALELVSFNLVARVGVNFDSVLIYAELRNTSATPQCQIFVDDLTITSSGRGSIYNVLAVTSGAPYQNSFGGTVSTACIPPGGVGFMMGIENDIDIDIVRNATAISMNFDPSGIGTYTPSSASPTVPTPTYANTANGWVVRGTATFPASVRNVEIEAAIRGNNGLMCDTRSAYNLGSLNAFSPWSWETFPTDTGRPAGTRIFTSFITNTSTLRTAAAAESPRDVEAAGRWDAFRSARDAAGL